MGETNSPSVGHVGYDISPLSFIINIREYRRGNQKRAKCMHDVLGGKLSTSSDIDLGILVNYLAEMMHARASTKISYWPGKKYGHHDKAICYRFGVT
jgi:hypothetical protein